MEARGRLRWARYFRRGRHVPERQVVTDVHKRKEDVIAELEAARQRIAELESEKGRRKRAENILRKNAEFLRGILDTTAAGVFVADREGTVVFANPRTEDFSGIPHEQTIGRSCLAAEWGLRDFWGRPLSPDEDPFVLVRDTEKQVVNREVSYIRPDGSLHYLLVNAAPLRDHQGHVSHVVVAVHEVTDQIRAQEAYRVLVEDSRQGFSLSQNGRVVYANPALIEMLGCRKEEFVGLSIADATNLYVHPEDREALLAVYQSLIEDRRQQHAVTYRLVRPDGAIRHIESYVSLTHFEGQPAVQIVNLDITRRRSAEKSLEDMRQNLQELFNRLDDFVFVLSLDGRILQVNPAVLNRLGYSEEQLNGSPITLVHPVERRWEAQEVVGAILCGRRTTSEIPLQTASGELIPVDTKVTHGLWNGEKVFYAVSRDVSERLEAEKKIREGERRFTEALKASRHVLYRFNILKNRYDYVSPHIEEFTGFSHEEFVSKGMGDIVKEIHPDDYPRLQAAMEEAVQNATGNAANLTIELRRRFKDGAYHWLSNSMMLLLDAGGSVEAIVGSVYNIEDRKRAEEELRESEKRFRLLADNSVDMISRHAPDGTVLFVSPSCEALSGYTPDELMGKQAELLMFPDDIEKVWKAITALRQWEDRYVVEHRLPRKDGKVIWVETSGRVLRDASGNVVEIQCAVRDITQRKRTEKALRQKDQHLREVLQAAPLILFAADLDGVCTFFEGRGLDALGVDPSKIIGTPMLEFFASRPNMKAWLERALAGEEFSVEYRHEPSGRAMVAHAAQLRDAEGKREGIVVVRVDVTQQKQAQEALNHAHAMFLSFAEQFPGTLFIKDEASRVLFANRTMREEFDAENWIGKPPEDYFPRAVAEKIRLDDQTALTKGPLTLDETYLDKHGRTRAWRTWKFPLEGDEGHTLLAGISYDITGQRQAENAFKTLVENSLQGLALVRNGSVVFVNPQASVITQYSREELQALKADDVFKLILPADHALVLDRIQRRQCGEELTPMFHMHLIRKDGAIRRLLVATSSIEYENAPVIQIAFLDVTDFPAARYGHS